jgi:hypothetical protein
MVSMMSLHRWAVLLAALLMAAPAGAPGAGAAAETRPEGQAGPGPDGAGARFWLPAGPMAGLPGVEEARAKRLWVSGEPLLASGALALEESGGAGEGGGGARAMELKFSGTHCELFVDSAAKPYPSDTTLQALANEFDQRIWPNNTATFGSIIWSSIDINIINMDGPWGVGGYFSPADPNAVYIDTADISYWGYQILAHEFQHLQHNQKDPDEALWVNEGCADLAIAVIYGQDDSTITGHVDGFEGNPDNDLTVFQNQMYDYGSAYAFVQYFWDRFGGQQTVKALVANKGNGPQGIDDTLASAGYPERWSGIFPDWCVANRLDDRSIDRGQYGYARLNIHVNLAGDYPTFPVCATATVNRWASDCYRFRGGNALDLLARLEAPSTGFTPRLFGLDPSGRNSTVLEMPLDGNLSAEALLRAFGRDYSEAILFTPSSAGGAYNYSARLVDRTPPVTTATVFPPEPDGRGGWYVRTPAVTLRSSEDGAAVFFRWDDQPVENYTAPIGAPEGGHVLWYFSVDGAGNRDEDRSLSFRVDTAAPEAGLSARPEAPDGAAGWYLGPPEISLRASEDAALFFAWDGSAFVDYTGPFRAPEGRHRLDYYAVDAAGNEGNTSTGEFLVDTRAPGAFANLTPALPDGGGGWYRTRPAVTIESEEPGALLLYRWDNGSEAAYVRPLAAPEGMHRLYYRARDPAGNNGTVRDILVRVDTLPPESAAAAEPRSPDGKAGWYRTRPTVTISLNDTDAAASAFFAWDDAEPGQYFGPFKAPEGVHTLRWFARDTRGNQGNESRRTFRVDSLAPATRLSVLPQDLGSEWYREAPEITLSTDQNAQAWYFWDDGLPQAYNGPFGAPEGEHMLSIQSRDAAGNSERQRTIEFRVDLAPPVAVLELSSTALLAGETLSLDGSGSTDQNGIEAYSIDFGDGARRTGPEKSWEHVYESPGVFTVVFKVQDKSGAWSDPVEANVTVTLPPRPPAPAAQEPALPSAGLPAAALAIVVLAAVGAVAFRRRRRSD